MIAPSQSRPFGAGARRGFTLVELMISVAILGLLASAAVPAYIRYVRRIRAAEAMLHVGHLYSGVQAYFAAGPRVDSSGNPGSFPPSVGWTPTLGICCTFRGQKCTTSGNSWTGHTWQALNFGIDDPFWNSYQVAVKGGDGSKVGDSIEVVAGVDLDCNGTFRYYYRLGTVDAKHNLQGSALVTESLTW